MAATFSIEWEPRTLNFQEIQLARETALYILNTNSMEEALQIFTKGLEPVTDLQGRSQIQVLEIEEGDFDEEDDDYDDEEEEEPYTNSIFFMSHGLEDVSTSPL